MGQSGDPVEKPSYLRVMRNHSLFSLWIGQLVSQFGDYIFNIALLWLVLTSTGTVFDVGLVQAVIWMPLILVGPFAGVFVDRLNRKDVIVASNLFQGAA